MANIKVKGGQKQVGFVIRITQTEINLLSNSEIIQLLEIIRDSLGVSLDQADLSLGEELENAIKKWKESD